MDTPIIGEDLKKIDNSNGGSLNHWVSGHMYRTFQNCYNIKYLAICLSGYMNVPTEPDFLALVHGIEYPMRHLHEPIMYPRKKIFETNESIHHFSSKQGMQKYKKISNNPTSFIHIFMHIMQEIYQIDSLSHRHITSSVVPSFNGVTRDSLRHLEAVTTQKQEQCIQDY